MLRVLVIDSDVEAGCTAAAILRLHGVATRLAPGGAVSAVQTAEAFQPHLVLLDLSIPGLGGFDTLSALRADPRVGPVRIVATTALSSRVLDAMVRRLGFDAHLRKPFDADALWATVLRLTEEHEQLEPA